MRFAGCLVPFKINYNHYRHRQVLQYKLALGTSKANKGKGKMLRPIIRNILKAGKKDRVKYSFSLSKLEKNDSGFSRKVYKSRRGKFLKTDIYSRGQKLGGIFQASVTVWKIFQTASDHKNFPFCIYFIFIYFNYLPYLFFLSISVLIILVLFTLILFISLIFIFVIFLFSFHIFK